MKTFVTEIYASDPITKQLMVWAGPHINALNYDGAVAYCQLHGLGYCKVVGELVEGKKVLCHGCSN